MVSTTRKPLRIRAAGQGEAVRSLTCPERSGRTGALGQCGPAIDRDVAEFFGLAARPAHFQTHGIGGRTQSDEYPRIVGGCIAAIRSRAAPQRSAVLANHLDARADLIASGRTY